LETFPVQQISEKNYELKLGEAATSNVLVCCGLTVDEPALHPLLALMPQLLLIRRAAPVDPTLVPLLDAMAEEIVKQRIGAATILARLADIVLAKVVRSWLESGREDVTGWLAAIRDPQLGRAIAAIHRRPGHPWTVNSLAGIARISRSLFSERFTSVVGLPPARYLARWRMQLASLWLRNDKITISEAASRLGYESEAAFSRAFKRIVGVPPVMHRKTPPHVAKNVSERVNSQGSRVPGLTP
jgi:AraC-like DNA-binding protein